jgi:hypothetical protein
MGLETYRSAWVLEVEGINPYSLGPRPLSADADSIRVIAFCLGAKARIAPDTVSFRMSASNQSKAL